MTTGEFGVSLAAMDTNPTIRQIEAAAAADDLRERAERWGWGMGVEPGAILSRGRGRPREPIILQKMIIWEARFIGKFSRKAVATALGVSEETVRRHELARKRLVERVSKDSPQGRFIEEFEARQRQGLPIVIEDHLYFEPSAKMFEDLRLGVKDRQKRRRRAAARAHAEGNATKA